MSIEWPTMRLQTISGGGISGRGKVAYALSAREISETKWGRVWKDLCKPTAGAKRGNALQLKGSAARF